jgi:hypothetical protein
MLWTHVNAPILNNGQFFDGKLLSVRAAINDCSWLMPQRAFCASHTGLSSCQYVLWIAKKSVRGEGSGWPKKLDQPRELRDSHLFAWMIGSLALFTCWNVSGRS